MGWNHLEWSLFPLAHSFSDSFRASFVQSPRARGARPDWLERYCPRGRDRGWHFPQSRRKRDGDTQPPGAGWMDGIYEPETLQRVLAMQNGLFRHPLDDVVARCAWLPRGLGKWALCRWESRTGSLEGLRGPPRSCRLIAGSSQFSEYGPEPKGRPLRQIETQSPARGRGRLAPPARTRGPGPYRFYGAGSCPASRKVEP